MFNRNEKLRALLTKVDQDEIYVINVCIALKLHKLEIRSVDDLLHQLNEIAVIDINTIKVLVDELNDVKFLPSNTFNDVTDDRSILSQLGISDKIAKILSIDDKYSEYMRSLRMELDSYHHLYKKANDRGVDHG